MRKSIKEVVKGSGIIEQSMPLVGEDFAEVLSRVPGAFVMLGCRNEAAGAIYPHHHPRFTIDERVLPIGVEIGVRYATRYLSQKNRE